MDGLMYGTIKHRTLTHEAAVLRETSASKVNDLTHVMSLTYKITIFSYT